MVNITDKFVDYLFEKAEAINDKIINKANDCRRDYMAVAEAGAVKNKTKWEKMFSCLPGGKTSVIGTGIKTDAKTAALINGFNAHSLELDDGHRFAMIHLGASIISAINAARDEICFLDNSCLKGIVLGYEAACRVAIAMQPSHKKRGYHTAGTCGTIGGAVGVAFALGMDKKQLKKVLTAAAGSSAGMLEIQEQDSEMKPYNIGRAAMDGLAAAYMGYASFGTPDDMLGGERGFFKMFSDSFDEGNLLSKQEYFEIERIYVKPYASCRHSHSAVEAAIILGKKTDASRIANVTVKTYSLGIKGHDHKEIKSVASAKLSTPYAVAAALIYGRADLMVFEPLDSSIIELAQKVHVVEDKEMTAECPAKRIAEVTVELTDGTTLAERVDYAKGEPENPMTEEDLNKKIDALFQFVGGTTKNNEGYLK